MPLCEQVKLSRVYLRDSTLVSPYPILLFGGAISVQHQERVIAVDDWITFKVTWKTQPIREQDYQRLFHIVASNTWLIKHESKSVRH